MSRLWLFSGLVFLLLGLFGYLHQKLYDAEAWNWRQFFTHETLTGLVVCVGITLLVVAAVSHESKTKKNIKEVGKKS